MSMTKAASQAVALTRLLTRVMRDDRGRLLSALVVRLRDFQLAEDVLQEAAVSALTHWGRSGLPHSPQGWLLKVALRKAIDRLRSTARANRNTAELALLAEDEAAETEPEMIPDERLRLIFTCCHPALEPKSRVALTLRSVAGLSTTEIAAAFLDAEPTMGQRLVRAKAKILAAGVPFAVPGPEDWPDRLNSVLTVVYLIFTTGYAMGPVRGQGLCREAVYLVRLLNQLAPGDPEIEGCLALILLTHSRARARNSRLGETIPLTEQDRGLWDHALIAEGQPLVEAALRRGAPGPFQIKAAIAACFVQTDGPDWPQITALYGVLLRYEPTPVIRLGRAVALAEAEGTAAGLAALATMALDLHAYQPFHAAHADMLSRSGAWHESRAAYDRAIALATNPGDAVFLTNRRDKLPIPAAE